MLDEEHVMTYSYFIMLLQLILKTVSKAVGCLASISTQ